MRTSIESAGDQFVGFVPDYSNGQVIVIGRDNVVFIPFNLIEQVQPIERESAAPLTDDQFNELMAGGDLANILDRETDGS
ncbi:MAG TPA: hypothetical protein VJ183_20155 [Chloroflexia bacterium]|nr:hypothetical protein [Chloroflexia bacterium]